MRWCHVCSLWGCVDNSLVCWYAGNSLVWATPLYRDLWATPSCCASGCISKCLSSFVWRQVSSCIIRKGWQQSNSFLVTPVDTATKKSKCLFVEAFCLDTFFLLSAVEVSLRRLLPQLLCNGIVSTLTCMSGIIS